MSRRIGTGLLRLALIPSRLENARIAAAVAVTSKRLYVLLEGDWSTLLKKDFEVRFYPFPSHSLLAYSFFWGVVSAAPSRLLLCTIEHHGSRVGHAQQA